jgi:hypothetical protein
MQARIVTVVPAAAAYGQSIRTTPDEVARHAVTKTPVLSTLHPGKTVGEVGIVDTTMTAMPVAIERVV